MTLRSQKICIKWLWPVKVTLKVIKRQLLFFCWSCDELHLKWEKKNFRASSLSIGIEWAYSWPSPNGRSMPLRPENNSFLNARDRLCFKGTVRTDWICMRVVSLESTLKGHQPLYVYNFLFLILNILQDFKVLSRSMQKWIQPPACSVHGLHRILSSYWLAHCYSLSELWPLIYAGESTFQKCKII